MSALQQFVLEEVQSWQEQEFVFKCKMDLHVIQTVTQTAKRCVNKNGDVYVWPYAGIFGDFSTLALHALGSNPTRYLGLQHFRKPIGGWRNVGGSTQVPVLAWKRYREMLLISFSTSKAGNGPKYHRTCIRYVKESSFVPPSSIIIISGAQTVSY
jgi:hypothetical protein